METIYPLEIISKKVKNSNVELVGVYHEFEFFKKYSKFYKEKIKRSPEGIILEQPIRTEFFENEDFFGNLGEIAYKNNILIYQADPINYVAFLDLVSSATGITLISTGLIENHFPLIPLGGSFLLGSLQFEFLIKQENQNSILNIISYGQTDWRNVRIAKGIEKICEKEKPKKIIAFHGAAHTRPIAYYLDHTKLRETKNILYAPLNLCGKKGVRKYIHNQDKENLKNYSQSWELKEVF